MSQHSIFDHNHVFSVGNAKFQNKYMHCNISPAKKTEDPLSRQLQLALQGKFEESFALNNELTARYPDNHRVAFNRGWFLLSQGNLREGFECLDRGRYENVFGSPPLRTPAPIWNGESLEGKTILLRGEGGLGDQIINVRFARNLARLGAKVVVSADGALLPVFQRVEGVSSCVLSGQEMSVFHHYWYPAMSIAGKLCKTYDDIDGSPYLTALSDANAKWQKMITKGDLKIGIKCIGNPAFEHEQFRKIPKELIWNALPEHNAVQYYSLEIDADNTLPSKISSLSFGLKTWEDTLSAISQLDLVITTCTSVAHAAAAMGKPTAILVPILPYYIWALPGEFTPWYDSVKLFRQTKFGEWDEPLKQIHGMLMQKITGLQGI